jgi:spermidine synthase
VSEPSNPWVSGVASLFTEEFYARLAGYLNEGGVLSQWLHTYEMDAPTLASILGAVSKTFPEFVVYTSIDSDIVLIARKGGGVGTFDPQVLQYPRLQPMLKKLKITEPQVIQRRAVASSALLRPMFASFGVRANSDYYPVVDQLASKTRFTQARVNELIDLEASAVPMREMLDGARVPSATRSDVIAATYLDVAIGHAWMVRDTIVGGDALRAHDPIFSQLQLAAKLVAQWASACPADLSFEQVLPSMVMAAEATVPHLDPETATALWRSIAQSRCARALTADQRRWPELFFAAARRDPDAMIDFGTRALEDKRVWRNPASEFAFFAAATAMVCRGKMQDARGLLEKSGQWVRAGVRGTELRALVTQSMSRPSASGCGAGER